MNTRPRVTLVIVTRNRAEQLARTLAGLNADANAAPVVVVNNGSTDLTASTLAQRFPRVPVVNLRSNLGAAGRNAGVRLVQTPYVAFCDDDTGWPQSSLRRAEVLLDAFPCIAVLSPRLLVGPHQKDDPACMEMAKSPLPSAGLPGRAVLSFSSGACVFRKEAFNEVGGYEPRLSLGGEASLLALDLAAAGWVQLYADSLIAYHHPPEQADLEPPRRALARNALWIAWLRRPPVSALKETWQTLRRARGEHALIVTCLDAASGLPWALRNRRVVPPRVEALRRMLG